MKLQYLVFCIMFFIIYILTVSLKIINMYFGLGILTGMLIRYVIYLVKDRVERKRK